MARPRPPPKRWPRTPDKQPGGTGGERGRPRGGPASRRALTEQQVAQAAARQTWSHAPPSPPSRTSGG
eukprot:4108388-Prymnesium_polylepis.2